MALAVPPLLIFLSTAALDPNENRHSWLARGENRKPCREVEELRRSLPMVAKAMSQIIAERRRQGVALFRKFVETQEGARQG